MKKTVTCKICEKDFKIVTSAHLKNHNISIAEYKARYGKETVSEFVLYNWKMKRTKNEPKEILDESNAVQCAICQEFHRALNLHLRFKHSISPEQYLLNFPDAKLYSEHIKNKMKQNSFMKKMTGVTLEQRLGKKKADKIKSKISLNKMGKKGPPRSEKGKQKMRDTWEKNRKSWSSAIKFYANLPERRELASQIQKNRIKRDGYHLARGKETALEKFVRVTIEELGYEVVRQKGTANRVLGAIRFFDIFVPALNLIIEADGEWWHRSPDRIKIDFAKTEAAIAEGYTFLRISDSEFGRINMDKNKLIEQILNLSPEEKLKKSLEIINARLEI